MMGGLSLQSASKPGGFTGFMGGSNGSNLNGLSGGLKREPSQSAFIQTSSSSSGNRNTTGGNLSANNKSGF